MIWYTIIGLTLSLTFSQRHNISAFTRSNGDLLRNCAQPAIGSLIVVAIGQFWKCVQLYANDWEYVFINQLNETVGIAAEHSFPWDDFFARSEYHNLKPYETAYTRLQPRMKAVLGYNYRFAIQRGKSLLFIPADFSTDVQKIFLLTEMGLEESKEEYYRKWSLNHEGQPVIFRNG